MRGFVNNLKDKTFGRLTVLERAGSYGNNAVWLCECKCGNLKKIVGQNLMRGCTKSCGCLAKELSSVRNSRPRDITGKKFGMLTAVKFIRKVGVSHIWLFECNCGSVKEMRKRVVVAPSSKTRSCGCYGKKVNSDRFSGSTNPKWRGGISPLRAKIRGLQAYSEWRRSVLRKDWFKCQDCGVIGKNLEVDHIKPFALILQENNITNLEMAMSCDELWDVNNGQVLCKDCHAETPTYKGRMFNILNTTAI